LESGNAPVDRAVGWRRNGEIWLPTSTWHQIFDENEADEAAAELNRNGLLRTPEGPGLQIIVKVRNKTHRVYAVKQRLSDWKLQDSVRGYDGSYSGKNSTTLALPAVLISLPPPPTFPPNFNELPPRQRQDYLDVRKKVSPLGLGWGPDFVPGQCRKWRISLKNSSN
jgi:hypothetical protein